MLAGRYTIEETRHLEHPTVRSCVLRVLVGPEVSFVDGYRWCGHAVSIPLGVGNHARVVGLSVREPAPRAVTTSCVERLDIHPPGSICLDLGKGLAYFGQEIRHEEEDRVWRMGNEHCRVDNGNVRPRHPKAVFGR